MEAEWEAMIAVDTDIMALIELLRVAARHVDAARLSRQSAERALDAAVKAEHSARKDLDHTRAALLQVAVGDWVEQWP